ncbi:MAG: TerC family protein [Acidobacteriota bacterium]|jgi:tellurite resistance protein TerC|nr:TerC family protein [Acidobacteriota bacterium]NLT32551.1 TerC family protein [Acidobacteriota bacterium]
MGAGIGTPELWVGFIIFVLAMLALDLGVFHRKAHEVSVREAFVWSVVWITLALVFNVGIYHWFGRERALEFFTGYLIEKALSVDNLFVFLVLFTYFAVPGALRHRVLFWGILGALVMRALFIAAGTALIAAFHWILYVFGAFLIFTGLKLLAARDEGIEPERNPVLRLIRRFLPSVPEYHGTHFVVKRAGRWYATPLLAVLIIIEATDIVFALDSIPAVFAITRDPFIVFTSNIFAVLGLRALFFLLAGMLGRFRYLKVGLGLVLAFVGTKMLLIDLVRVPIALSLGVIALLLSLSVAASLLRPGPAPGAPVEPD